MTTESSTDTEMAASMDPAMMRRRTDVAVPAVVTWIKRRLGSLCSPRVYGILAKAWGYHLAFKHRQARHRFGDKNPQLTFYVIRRQPPGAGLFSNVWHVISHVSRVKRHGWIPVVDMENYPTFYNEPGEIHRTFNAWEYYFKQPSAYSLSDVYDSSNVVVSGMGPIPPHLDLAFCSDFSGDLNGLSDFIRANIVLTPEVEAHLAGAEQKLFRGGPSVLGVSSRGTDYTALKPRGHPRQPEIGELISRTRELITAWKPDKIFVTTEERSVVDAFDRAFPGMVITTDRFFIADYDGRTLVPQIDTGRENGKYVLGLEYLVDIYVLSKCDYFLGTLTCGTRFALAMNGGRYKEKCIIDLGVYT